jgi:hypothetical protein
MRRVGKGTRITEFPGLFEKPSSFLEKNRKWAGRDAHPVPMGVVSGPQVSTVAVCTIVCYLFQYARALARCDLFVHHLRITTPAAGGSGRAHFPSL